MKGHSILAPSKASRWMYCPGSIWAELTALENQGGEKQHPAAALGETKHEITQQLLVSGATDEDMEDAGVPDDVRFAVNSVVKTDIFEDWDCEITVDLTHIHKECYGTLDYWCRKNNELHLYDFKFGRVPVKAAYNHQLELYLLGIVDWDFDTAVYTYIIQPNAYNGQMLQRHEINLEELKAKIPLYQALAATAVSANPPRIAGKTQCQWCAAKSTCIEFLTARDQGLA